MITAVHVGGLVDVQSECKFPVPLQACAFVIAGQGLSIVSFTVLRSAAFHLLLLSLAVASNEYLALAWFVLLAWEWGVASIFDVRMTTNFLLLPTRLLARLAMSIFTLSRCMARLQAIMRATLELLPTYFSAANIRKPTLLILQSLLATHAPLLHKKRTLGASFIVLMAVVRNNRMAT